MTVESVEITVRRYIGTYIARARGLTASATASPQYAAKRCAMKLFPGSTITTVTLTDLGDERDGFYRYHAENRPWGARPTDKGNTYA